MWFFNKKKEETDLKALAQIIEENGKIINECGKRIEENCAKIKEERKRFEKMLQLRQDMLESQRLINERYAKEIS